MNKLIKELAVKTDAWCDQNHFGKSDYDLQWEAKFAELIIKECASICETEGQTYKYSFAPAKARLAESTSNHCATLIKQKFGVE